MLKEQTKEVLKGMIKGEPQNEDRIKVWFTEYAEDLQDVEVLVNVYDYLKNHLKYAEKMDKQFQKFTEDYRHTLQGMEEFGIENGYNVDTINTYNYGGECVLDNDIQFTLYMEDQDIYSTKYVALSVHNGKDPRGNYAKPHIFKIKDIGYFMMGLRDLSARDIEGQVYGHSDDGGYTWRDINPENVILEPENNKAYYKFEGNELKFHGMVEF